MSEESRVDLRYNIINGMEWVGHIGWTTSGGPHRNFFYYEGELIADEEIGTEGCSASRETRCAYHLSAPRQGVGMAFGNEHTAGWQGEEHAELSTQTNQAVVYVSGRTHHTLRLPVCSQIRQRRDQ